MISEKITRVQYFEKISNLMEDGDQLISNWSDEENALIFEFYGIGGNLLNSFNDETGEYVQY